MLPLSLVAGDLVMKLGLYFVCRRYSNSSATAAALTQDHRNDLVLNSVAIVTSAIGLSLSHLHRVDSEHPCSFNLKIYFYTAC